MTDGTKAAMEAYNGYRISTLVEAAGVSRDMIKYYLRADLLPPAEKPRANLSIYTDQHRKLIGLIRKFQQQTRLSLPEIAGVFRAADYDPGAIELELLSDKYASSYSDNIIPLHGEAPELGNLTIPPQFRRKLGEYDLLDNPHNPDEDEQGLVGLLWAAHSAGVPLDFLQAARARIAELADMEVKTLIGIKRPELSFTELVRNVAEVDHIINRWIVVEKNRRIRGQFQRVVDNSQQAISTLLDTLYQPSALFHERHGTAALLAEIARRMQDEPEAVTTCNEVRFASLLLGNYALTTRMAEAALAKDPGDTVARACIALAHGMQDNADAAFTAVLPLEDCASTHPIILQARLLALLLKAAQMGGVADTNELMKNAADLFLELPQDITDAHPEAILLLARANVGFPDFANSARRAIDALALLLAKLDDGVLDLDIPDIPGLRETLLTVYRIYTLYYLGVLHMAEDEQAAAKSCFEQVLQLDPASNFGESAYRALGSDGLNGGQPHGAGSSRRE